MKKRAFVAMSGGVDSSVVAAILKKEGYDVVGATLQLYEQSGPAKRGSCCAGKDIADARMVADKLGFPHYVINAEQRFKESVIDEFARSYARGETPVPCVSCNQGVKFSDLLKTAKDLDCDFMATGHYVRKIAPKSKRSELHRPVDLSRDQSWFMFATTQEQLDYLEFPLGSVESKDEVRRMAEEFGLDIADKADSQDICFVQNGSYASLVEQAVPEIRGEGEILDADGRVVGRHRGIAHYTIGQSKLLGDLHTKLGERQMVVDIDAEKRTIRIEPRSHFEDDKTQAWRKFPIRDVNWLFDAPDEFKCRVQLRAQEPTRAATILKVGDRDAEVVLEEPALATPGQACVFYDDSRVLGGGFIKRV